MISAEARLPRVLLITDETHPRGLVAPVLDALAPFTRLDDVHVQLRAPSAGATRLAAAARALRPHLDALGVPLVVNRRVDVALAVGAAGVHLPERGLSAHEARALMPHGFFTRACHDAAGLERAAQEGALYAVLSPVFEVPGKNAPLGAEGLGLLLAHAKLPVIALGGITFDNASSVIGHGAIGIAAIRAVLGAEHPAAALAQLLSAARVSQR